MLVGPEMGTPRMIWVEKMWMGNGSTLGNGRQILIPFIVVSTGRGWIGVGGDVVLIACVLEVLLDACRIVDQRR